MLSLSLLHSPNDTSSLDQKGLCWHLQKRCQTTCTAQANGQDARLLGHHDGLSVQEQEEPPELQHARQQLQATTDATEGPATDDAPALENGGDKPNGPSSTGLAPVDGAYHLP